ncbi:MAG: FecCD family ABC transporter permease [Candidatus Latescibacterota bacterium]
MKKNVFLLVLALAALATLVLSPVIGMRRVPLEAVLHPFTGGVEADIFWRMRIPRTLVAFLAGTALSLSGMAFQALFRNPLATPFTLGVASGAAFGAAVSVLLGISFSFLGVSGQAFGSLAGALLTIGAVYGLSQTRRGFSTTSMLLAGVAVSFFFSSLILFLQYLSDFTQSFRIVRWLMGGIEVAGYGAVFGLLPFTLAGGATVFFLSGELNLITTGEDIAASRGVEVNRVRTVLFLAVSLMVGGVVAVCGPIGFVGLMAPHISRLLVGANHRHLAPASLLFGGAFLTLCDTLARTVIAPAEIPVGVITAILGGPFFLWLLISPKPKVQGPK